jgi:Fungal specific transcription factor domain
MDSLIGYYFGYCNWIHRYVYQGSYLPAWERFKAGLSPDRLVLATACVLVALAIRYLPIGHELLSSFPQLSNESACLELSSQYYDVMKKVLRRYQDETKVYSLELVELLLARCHYLTYSRSDAEEIWSVRGEVVTIATAMGLHRDPGNCKYSEEVAERRRWAWWHTHLVDR